MNRRESVIPGIFILAAPLAALIAPDIASGAQSPLAGCYERIYDSAHLTAHKSQIVTRVTLLVKARETAPAGDIAAGDLRIWTRGHKARFDTLGVCFKIGDKAGYAMSCRGSVSAAESDVCKTRKSGVHDCRMKLGDSGGYEVAKRAEGVVITVRGFLELLPAPYDSAPFLNLSGEDVENRSFFLEPASHEACN